MDKLDAVIAANTVLGRDRLRPVDAFGEIQIRNFVHLMEAAHESDSLGALTEALVSLVRESCIDVSAYGAVFAPKLGNVLLGKAVADALKLPSGFIRGSVLIERFVETCALSGTKAILVDDVSSEGALLSDCIRDAREDGFTVDVVFTVLDRAEGDARDRLHRDHGVPLYSCKTVNDDALDQLMQRFRKAAGGGESRPA